MDTLNITFYSVNDDYRVLNKTLGEGAILDCQVRTPIDFINPTFYIKNWDNKYNYLLWDNKYYFINQVNYNADKSYRVECHIDNLMTYKTDIEKSNNLGNVKLTFDNPFNDNGVNILLGITNL